MLPMYKMLNQIESTADLGRVLFIDFMTSPQARSSARDDKKERVVARKGRLLDERAVAEPRHFSKLFGQL